MEAQELQQYIPVLMLFAVAAAIAVGGMVASKVVGWWGTRLRKSKVGPARDIAYECGMLPVGEGTPRFSVKFYLVAMLFILFDIEVIFLFPWAVVFKDMLAENAGLILGSMFSFLGILFVGYIYAFKKRAFEW